MQNTLLQYEKVISRCREIFENKTKDYGTSWRVMRPKSITDQLYIKAQRIQNIENSGKKLIDEDVDVEFVGIINYALIGLILLEMAQEKRSDLSEQEALALYDKKVAEVKSLMMAKNHDYGEAWRSMRISSFTDLILMKILRIKQIEDNNGKTLISEGIEAGYADIINYAVFALIKLAETED
ncbi:MAG: DUF1599 domain-containing protein [Chitinophagales bacterium]|nr:DUF1599 domain-containing protein [Chitinophagales bacterium]MDW8272645.1 DUF1599 domain-containing protein [Chitinophagales bacterium]